MSLRRPAVLLVALTLALALALSGCQPGESRGDAPIRIGAVFPMSGSAAALAGPELTGVRIAADIVNADGGIAGRRIELEVRDLRSRAEAETVMGELRDLGIRIVIGAYSSELSIAASEAASKAGLLYWEAGAVADQLTGRGLPMVFRVGTSGSTLGSNSSTFAARELAGRLGKSASELRVAIAVADDDYANAVADAAESTAGELGMPVVLRRGYNLYVPDWPAVMADLAAVAPDVIILASHIPDGIAFRQAMLAAGLRVGALIGSTMAECDPDFAGVLGQDAVGIFASDRPTAGFKPTALGADAADAYARFETAWRAASAGGVGDSAADGEDGGSSGDGRYGGGSSRIHGPVGGRDRRGIRGGARRLLCRMGAVPTRPAGRARGVVQHGGAVVRSARSAPGRRGGSLAGPARRFAPQRRGPPLLTRRRSARAERACRRRHLAMDRGPHLFVRLAAQLRDGRGRIRAPRAMTARSRSSLPWMTPGRARIAGRAEWRTWIGPVLLLVGLVLVIATRVLLVRAGVGPLVVGAAFGILLLALVGGGVIVDGAATPSNGGSRTGSALPLAWRDARRNGAGLIVGVAFGLGLVALTVAGPALAGMPHVPGLGRQAGPFAEWAVITMFVVGTQEVLLRGVLLDQLGRAAGVVPAILVTSAAFALMHVPLYGWHVVPLDFAVGLGLAGLRIATRSLVAPAAAHSIADLATWWL